MDQIKEFFGRVKELAVNDGAQVEMLMTGGENLTLRYEKEKLRSFDSSQSQMAGLRVLFQNQQGYAYTEKLDEESLIRTYRDALENAKTVQKPTEVDIEMVKPSQFSSMPQLVDDQEVPIEKKMEAASLAESLCYKKDKRIESVPYVALNESKGFRRILNSNGVDQSYRSSAYVTYAYPLAKEGDSTKMMSSSLSARSFSNLNVEKMVNHAVEDVISVLNAETLKSDTYAVVIRGDQAETILSMIHNYFSAKAVYEKKSLYKEKMNQVVASSVWTVVDDPTNVRGLAARPFDDEGSPSQRTTLIEDGKLKSFISNFEYSQKMKIPLTAHASRSPSSEMGIGTTNLFVRLGSSNRKALLSKYPKTVFITHFTAGLHSSYNETTGDISMPCEGLLYENGQLSKPVDQFILSINVMDLMMQTEAMGDSYMDSASSYFCPDILLGSVKLAGA